MSENLAGAALALPVSTDIGEEDSRTSAKKRSSNSIAESKPQVSNLSSLLRMWYLTYARGEAEIVAPAPRCLKC